MKSFPLPLLFLRAREESRREKKEIKEGENATRVEKRGGRGKERDR